MKITFKLQTKSYLYVGVLLLSLFSLNSCGIGLIVRGAAKKSISVEKGTAPKTFIGKDEVLLLLLWENKAYDKQVKKAFDKFYEGKKEYVTYSELKSNEKYQNLDKYPFVFSQGPENKMLYEGTGNFSYTFTGSRPFHIYDRREKTFHMSRFTSGFYGRMIQAYAMKLNKIRVMR